MLNGFIIVLFLFLDKPQWFHFYLPYEDTTNTEISLDFLNESITGNQGFLKVNPRGNLIFEKDSSEKIRFFGIQSFHNNPSKETSKIMVKRLSKFGFNIWKWGGMEKFWHKKLFKPAWKENIDKFDYLFFQMKKHGIYCYAQLDEYSLIHASLLHKEAKEYYNIKQIDSFPSEISTTTKSIQFIMEPSLWKAQKTYWYNLFNHENPYTGLKYKNDPAIVLVELTNENYLLTRWEHWKIEYQDWPPIYQAHFLELWNKWLKRKYRTDKNLYQSWEQAGKIDVKPSETLGHVDFLPISCKDPRYSDNRKKDIAKFLYYLQKKYFKSCVDYLRNIGVKSLIVYGNANTMSLPTLFNASKGDIIDTHTYFDHPDRIGHQGEIKNLNPFKTNSTLISVVGANTVKDKSISISETNWSYPNQHQYLFLPFLSILSSLHDWDILILHAYCSDYTYKCKLIEQQLVFGNNTLMMAQAISASLIYRTALIKSDSVNYTINYSDPWENYLENYWNRFPGVAVSKSSTNFLPISYRINKCFNKTQRSSISLPDISNTEQLKYRTNDVVFDRKSELFKAENNYMYIYCGRLNGKTFNSDFANIKNIRGPEYSSIIFIPLDGRKIQKSERILMTTISEVRNSEAKWKKHRKSFSKWGKEPILVTKSNFSIEINNLGYKEMEVWALDTLGAKSKKVSSKARNNMVYFEITGQYNTIWYEIIRKR